MPNPYTYDTKLNIHVDSWHNNCGVNVMAVAIRRYLANKDFDDSLLSNQVYQGLLACFNQYYDVNLNWEQLKKFLINLDHIELETFFAPVLRAYSKDLLKDVSLAADVDKEKLADLDKDELFDDKAIGNMLLSFGIKSVLFSKETIGNVESIILNEGVLGEHAPTALIYNTGLHWHIQALDEAEHKKYLEDMKKYNVELTKATSTGLTSTKDGEIRRMAIYNILGIEVKENTVILPPEFSGESIKHKEKSCLSPGKTINSELLKQKVKPKILTWQQKNQPALVKEHGLITEDLELFKQKISSIEDLTYREKIPTDGSNVIAEVVHKTNGSVLASIKPDAIETPLVNEASTDLKITKEQQQILIAFLQAVTTDGKKAVTIEINNFPPKDIMALLTLLQTNEKYKDLLKVVEFKLPHIDQCVYHSMELGSNPESKKYTPKEYQEIAEKIKTESHKSPRIGMT